MRSIALKKHLKFAPMGSPPWFGRVSPSSVGTAGPAASRTAAAPTCQPSGTASGSAAPGSRVRRRLEEPPAGPAPAWAASSTAASGTAGKVTRPPWVRARDTAGVCGTTTSAARAWVPSSATVRRRKATVKGPSSARRPSTWTACGPAGSCVSVNRPAASVTV